MNLRWLPWLLQTSDAQFPTGAYAHSLGLEEIVRLNVVRDEATLVDFLKNHTLPMLGQFDLPKLRIAWEAAQNEDLPALIQQDHELAAWKVCRELREASCTMGERRLRAVRQINPTPFLDTCAERLPWKHHLIILGIQLQNAPLEAALYTHCHQTISGFCSAALKLIRIGQEGCQRTLHSAMAQADVIVEKSLSVEESEIGWFNPLVDIASMHHEQANERLFIS